MSDAPARSLSVSRTRRGVPPACQPLLFGSTITMALWPALKRISKLSPRGGGGIDDAVARTIDPGKLDHRGSLPMARRAPLQQRRLLASSLRFFGQSASRLRPTGRPSASATGRWYALISQRIVAWRALSPSTLRAKRRDPGGRWGLTAQRGQAELRDDCGRPERGGWGDDPTADN
jgi:hypothetical protein